MQKTVVLGIEDQSLRDLEMIYGKIPDEILKAFLSMKMKPYGRLLFAMKQFLEQKFEKVDIFATFEDNILSNGTWIGLIGNIFRSEVDVGIQPLLMREEDKFKLDFSYPYKLSDYTFITEPPEYVPHIFDIFQTFNLSVWLALATFVIGLWILYYFILKRKFHLKQVLLHIWAVLMKQSALLIPLSLAEKVLFFSWVLGAMILCLSFESVILSFLSFPPVNKIKDLSDLASATQKGEIHCIGLPYHEIYGYIVTTNPDVLKAIADDIHETRLRIMPLVISFLKGERKTNLALLAETSIAEICVENNFFVSEDRFFQNLAGMPMRKDFCCKQFVDIFVHRILESGIYYKYFEEFNIRISREMKYFANEIPERKLTLTDIAPAFIFLLCGYLIALIVFVYEMLSNRKNHRQ